MNLYQVNFSRCQKKKKDILIHFDCVSSVFQSIHQGFISVLILRRSKMFSTCKVILQFMRKKCFYMIERM